MKSQITVALITFNEEDRIINTLNAVKSFADEIVVVDSGSTDRTVEICKSFGAQVYSHKFEGFTSQKNRLLQYCKSRWILFLDADEVVTEDLSRELLSAVKSDAYAGYYINRKVVYLGRKLNYAWQPNFRLRLVKSDANPVWKGGRVHEELIIDGSTARLESPLLHYSYRNIFDHFTRTVKYAKQSELDYLDKEKKSGVIQIVFKPGFAFFRSYILKRGFLDGVPGFIAAVSASVYVFLKYSMLYEDKN